MPVGYQATVVQCESILADMGVDLAFETQKDNCIFLAKANGEKTNKQIESWLNSVSCSDQ